MKTVEEQFKIIKKGVADLIQEEELQKAAGKEQQIAIFMPILEGLDGIEKMSKSLGNYIGIKETAEVMFKKVMEIPDNLIIRYFELATDEHPHYIQTLQKKLEDGENPRNIKFYLAHCITELYHGSEETSKAEEYYNTVYQNGEIPEDIPELILPSGTETLLDLVPILIQKQFIPSGSELRRLVKQGEVQINGEKVLDIDLVFVEEVNVLKFGKKKFIRVKRLQQ